MKSRHRPCKSEHSFVSAVYLLLKEQISERDFCEARALLCKFALRMGVLYGNENMSYNIHQLLHLADAVAAWGPPGEIPASLLKEETLSY